MSVRGFNKSAPLQSLRGASVLTGLSVSYLREGCKSGRIAHIMCGKEYRVNMPRLWQELGIESGSIAKGGDGE